jgi:hypothetical protein
MSCCTDPARESRPERFSVVEIVKTPAPPTSTPAAQAMRPPSAFELGGTFKEVAGNPHIQVFEPRIDGFFWTALAIVFGGALLFFVGGTVQLAAGIHGLTRARGSRTNQRS